MTESSEARGPGRPVTVTCALLRDWVRAAQPGARLIYGRGGVVAHACSSNVREFVMKLYEKGLLTPHRTKDDQGPIQIVVRTPKPVLKGDPLSADEPTLRRNGAGR